MTSSDYISLIPGIGVAKTLQGFFSLGQGRIQQGVQRVFLGMSVTNLGGRALGLSPTSHANLMKYILGVGAATAVGARAAECVWDGIQQKSPVKIIKGILQTTVMGTVGCLYINSLDAKIIVVAHQAALVVLSSSYIGKLGVQDLANGHYTSGAFKLLTAIGGIAAAGFYFYHAGINPSTLAPEELAFVESHKSELEYMYDHKEAVGNWELFGKGASKTVFTHPDLPEMLVKIPNSQKGFWGITGDDDLRRHYNALEEIKPITEKFNLIVLPQSHLIEMNQGVLLVEQKLHTVNYDSIPQNAEWLAAVNQFTEFVDAAGICDAHLRDDHNAGFIADATNGLRIGVFDADCWSFVKTMDKAAEEQGYKLLNVAMGVTTFVTTFFAKTCSWTIKKCTGH